MKRKLFALGGAIALATVGLTACGEDGGAGGGDGLVIGTMETITALDPAGSYDFGSSNMQYAIYEQLMVVPAGDSQPVPDAAESCTYDNPKKITCKLREGIKFSNGHELTSSDVLFSLKRNIEIANANGASGLLASISNGNVDKPALAPNAVETPDDLTVVFNLNSPDLTFLHVLTHATASIVDEEEFPAGELLPDADVVGSGPYQLSQYEEKQQAVLEKNAEYTGTRTPTEEQVFVQFYSEAAPMKSAVKSGEIDIAWRTLSPTDLADIEKGGDAEVVRGEGSEFRYWVWQLENKTAKDVAVRQSVAQLIDRAAIAENAYDGTVEPAYSIVPPGFDGQVDSYQEAYGEPSVDAAKKILTDAGVKTPVKLTLGYTPTHYGPNAVDEANELRDQLNESGLFEATIEDAEWEEYQTLYKEGAYDLFILGWYPDYMDADNYLSPFLRDGGFYANGYSSKQVNSLLTKELGEQDPAARNKTLEQIQEIAAKDVPLIPSWWGQNIAVARPGVTGVKETLDAAYIFRLWAIGKD